MTINDFRNIEFGVCFDVDNEVYHFKIPVDNTVKAALVEMRNTFSDEYDSLEGDAADFEVSEKYSSTEKLRINLNQTYLASLNNLFHHQNIPVNNVDLSQYLKDTEYYFAEFLHTNGTKTIGVKRPNQFKGLLEKKIVRLFDNSLQAVEDNIFKLDNDFDFLIHDTFIEILHPAGFIYITNLEEQIFDSIRETARQIGVALPFVDLNVINDYVITKRSKKGAKLLASINSRIDLPNTSQEKLFAKCQNLGLSVALDGNNRLVTEDDHVIDFLEILDRRVYDYDLTTDEREMYVASSRRIKSRP